MAKEAKKKLDDESKRLIDSMGFSGTSITSSEMSKLNDIINNHVATYGDIDNEFLDERHSKSRQNNAIDSLFCLFQAKDL